MNINDANGLYRTVALAKKDTSTCLDRVLRYFQDLDLRCAVFGGLPWVRCVSAQSSAQCQTWAT